MVDNSERYTFSREKYVEVDGKYADAVIGDFQPGALLLWNVNLVVSVSGLTIADGSKAYGAGLVNFGTLTVSDCAFANNTATNNGGGGIYNVGVLTVSNCVFTGNVANPTATSSSAGGGILSNFGKPGSRSSQAWPRMA